MNHTLMPMPVTAMNKSGIPVDPELLQPQTIILFYNVFITIFLCWVVGFPDKFKQSACVVGWFLCVLNMISLCFCILTFRMYSSLNDKASAIQLWNVTLLICQYVMILVFVMCCPPRYDEIAYEEVKTNPTPRVREVFFKERRDMNEDDDAPLQI